MQNLKRKFKHIAETTSIQGLHEAFRAKSNKGTVFWLVLVLATNGLTAYQVFLAVRQYVNQDASTQIEVLEKGRLFYPPLKLCYWPWIRWVNFTNVEKLGIDKQTLLQAMSFVDTIYTEDEFNFTNAEEDFQRFILKNGYKTLEQFYQAIAKKNPPGFAEFIEFGSISFNGVYACYSANINHYYEQDAQSFYSVDVFKKLLGNNRPQKMDVRLMFTPNLLPNNRKEYLTDAEYISYIKSFLNRVGTPVTVMETYLLETEDLLQKGYEFNAPSYVIILETDEVTNILPVSNQYDVKVYVDVHRFLNTPSSPCVEEKQSYPFDYECLTICLHEEALSCNCAKKFYKDLQKNHSLQDVCRYSIYDTNETIIFVQHPSLLDVETLQSGTSEGCLANFTLIFSTCLPKCQIKGCEVWRVETSKNELPFFLDHYISQNHFVKILISYPLEDNIFVVREIETAQWYDIISNIGGLLGIWMGASILSYVHMLYVFCDCDGSHKLGDEIRQ